MSIAERRRKLALVIFAWAVAGSTACSGPQDDAARDGHQALVKQLASEGAETDRTGEEASPSLHAAAEAGQVEVAELLLSQGANVNAVIDSDEGRKGWTALHIAAARGDADMASLLISHKANVDAVAQVDEKGDGLCPLHLAARNGEPATAELLLAKGADIEARAPGGWTAFHLAAFGNFVSVAIVLQDHADLSQAQNPYNLMRPLHVAARNGRQEMVEYLLLLEVDLNPRNKMGRTPTQEAIIKGHEDLAAYMKDMGGIE